MGEMLLFSGEGPTGSQIGLPRVTRPVGRGAGFRRRPAGCRAVASPTTLPASTVKYGKREEVRGGWDVAPRQGTGGSSMSRPSLVHRLASVSPSRTGDRALEPPPASASIQVSQSSSSAFISTQSLGKRPPPPYPRGQPWAWGAPLLLDRAVNKSTPWLPATLHGPLSNAGIGVVFNRHSHESLIAGFQLLKEPLFVLVLVFLLTNQTASGPSSSVAPDGGDGRRQGRRRKGRPDSDSSRAGEPSPEAPWLQRPMAGSPRV